MNLRGRLVSAMLVAALLAVALAVIVGAAVHRSGSAVDDVADRWDAAAVAADSFFAHAVDEETGERGYVITGQSTYLQPYHLGMTTIPSDLTRLRHLTAGNGEIQAAITVASTQLARWQQQAARPEIAARRNGGLSAGVRSVANGPGKKLFDRLRIDVARLQAAIERQRSIALHRVHGANGDLTAALWISAAAVVGAGLGAFAGLNGWVLGPLHQLSSVLRRVAGGDLATTVTVAGPPEFTAVAADADAMRRRILDELSASERSREALEQQGPVVVGLSEQLAASRTEPIPGLRFAATLHPAEGILAGDWLEVLHLSGNRAALVLVDVSGHGALAGLEAIRLKYVITTALRAGHSPDDAFALAAEGFHDADRFATGIIVVIDLATGELQWSNAGHLPPIITSGNAGAPDVELQPTGPFLSMHLTGWRTDHGRLSSGQTLVAYSDGLTEARDDEARQFGIEGIHGVLAATAPGDVDAVIAACLQAVTDHATTLRRDDIALIAATPEPVGPAEDATDTDGVEVERR